LEGPVPWYLVRYNHDDVLKTCVLAQLYMHL